MCDQPSRAVLKQFLPEKQPYLADPAWPGAALDTGSSLIHPEMIFLNYL